MLVLHPAETASHRLISGKLTAVSMLVCVSVCVCVCVHLYMYVCMCVHVSVCVCVMTYISEGGGGESSAQCSDGADVTRRRAASQRPWTEATRWQIQFTGTSAHHGRLRETPATGGRPCIHSLIDWLWITHGATCICLWFDLILSVWNNNGFDDINNNTKIPWITCPLPCSAAMPRCTWHMAVVLFVGEDWETESERGEAGIWPTTSACETRRHREPAYKDRVTATVTRGWHRATQPGRQWPGRREPSSQLSSGEFEATDLWVGEQSRVVDCDRRQTQFKSDADWTAGVRTQEPGHYVLIITSTNELYGMGQKQNNPLWLFISP